MIPLIERPHPKPLVLPKGVLSLEERQARQEALQSPCFMSQRLWASPLRLTDAPEVAEIFAPLATARQTHAIAHPYSLGLAKAYVEAAQNASIVGLRDRQGDLIGLMGLSHQACGSQGLTKGLGPYISLFIHPEHQAKGYGLEALEAAWPWMVGDHRLKCVQAVHFSDNEASQKLLIRAGFLYTGRKSKESSLARSEKAEVLHMIRLL